jgi:hypothetical protein
MTLSTTLRATTADADATVQLTRTLLFTDAFSRTHNEGNPVQRLKFVSVFAALLLLGLVPAGALLAQQAPTPAPLVLPPGPVSHFPSRFDVVDAPAQFDQVLKNHRLPERRMDATARAGRLSVHDGD